jgi:ATPase family associated with various cellular activities (AAA)/Winged helix domain, variant
MTSDATAWPEANQRYLMAALADVRELLAARAQSKQGPAEAGPARGAARQAANHSQMSPAPALEALCSAFGLSEFERDLLLLCAGIELDGAFATLCATAHGDPARPYPTFGLALAALREPHWSALSLGRPLRYWRLIEVATGVALTLSPLRIDERVLHYLAGVQQLDERLSGLVEPLQSVGEVVPSHRALAERIAAAWAEARSNLPVVHLYGADIGSKRAVAKAACSALELSAHVMSADAVPAAPAELETLARLWEREVAFGADALLLDCDGVDAADPVRSVTLSRLIQRIHVPLIVMSREPWRTPHIPAITLEVLKPNSAEQQAVWTATLRPLAGDLNGMIDRIVTQFSFEPSAIREAGEQMAGLLRQRHDAEPGDLLWDLCRNQARRGLDDLAQRIEPTATMDDLVLPATEKSTLRDVAVHVRYRATVYEAWGFAKTGTRGLGISALFAGASGTGKTMAAEALASELSLDLYRIDLSSVVSKYIGETEKNLRRVFDAAEDSGAILLFDEADALFGKRSEVKDSHDRYANIEISYLLQRMEAYRGLAILTTNLKSALDQAFLRRIRFVVQFPFPDAQLRAEIWRRVYPPQTPAEDLDVQKLAQLNVPGGGIRNIALNAAFLAAEAGEPVRMGHLLRAARNEYAKLERPLTDAEIGGWQ